jgi:hypothetical protein
MRATWFLGATLAILPLSGCGSLTFSPSVGGDAVANSDAMGKFTESVLLMNVLRARDYAPLDMSQLSSVNGSLSLQGTVGLSIPYGVLDGAGRHSVSPSVTATNAPTYSLAELDTQGFTISLLQPVSPVYIASKFHDNYDKQFLLYLFIKSIKYADESRVFNNPDDSTQMTAFSTLVEDLISNDVDMKSLTLLEPVGSAYDPLTITNVAVTTAGETKGTNPTTTTSTATTPTPNPVATAVMSGLSFAAGLGDAQYHVGNAWTPGKGIGNLRLYRIYSNQVALCKESKGTHKVFSPGKWRYEATENTPPVAPAIIAENKGAISLFQMNMKMHSPGSGSPQATGTSPGGSSKGSNPAGGSTSGSGSAATLTAAINLNRIGSILDTTDCEREELVLPPMTEEQFSKRSGQFAEVEWRSVSEVFGYLGALARHQGEPGQPSWKHQPNATDVLFRTSPDSTGRIVVSYQGEVFSVHGAQSDRNQYPTDDPNDHSLQTLSLLSELVNAAKVSSDITNNQPLELVTR